MAYKKITGVYLIQSILKPERIYIGSGMSIKRRWNTHINKLRKNKHHSPQMQRHYNKYGEEDFMFMIIEEIEFTSKKDLLDREQKWILYYKYKDTNKPYFNCAPLAYSKLGVKECEHKRMVMRERMLGNTICKGLHWKLSEETKQRQREANLGEKNPMYGKHISEKHRQAIIASNKRRGCSKETRRKRSESLLRYHKNKKIKHGDNN